MKVWDVCQLPSLFYWRIACGAFQSICPSGVLLSTCFPLEQGNGLLKTLRCTPQSPPDPNAVWHDTVWLEGRGPRSGLQLAHGTCLGWDCHLTQRAFPSEDMPTWPPVPLAAFPSHLLLFPLKHCYGGNAFCICGIHSKLLTVVLWALCVTEEAERFAMLPMALHSVWRLGVGA